MNTDNKNNTSLWAVAFGAAVGGAAVYYLNTKEGKKATKKAKKEFKRLEAETRKTLKAQSDMIAEKTSNAASTTKTWLDETTAAAKDKVANFKAQAEQKAATLANKAEDVAEDTQNSFERGMEKAKRTLQEKSNKIEHIVDKNRTRLS